MSEHKRDWVGFFIALFLIWVVAWVSVGTYAVFGRDLDQKAFDQATKKMELGLKAAELEAKLKGCNALSL